MATERLKSPRARLFVALELPEEVREALARWQATAVAGEPALRAPASETLHVTLCFIGYVAERRIDDIVEIVQGVDPRPVEVRFELEPVGVPRRGRASTRPARRARPPTSSPRRSAPGSRPHGCTSPRSGRSGRT